MVVVRHEQASSEQEYTLLTQIPPATQRIGVLANLATLLPGLGVTAQALSDKVGFDVTTLTPEDRMPLRRSIDLLEAAAALTGCPHLGLLLGTTAMPSTQGDVYRLAINAPTFRQCLLDHITWQPGYANGAILYLNRFGEDYALGYGVLDRHSGGSVQLYDLVMSLVCTLVGQIMGPGVEPVEVMMSRRPPEDLLPYRRILKVPVRFNEAQTCVVLPQASLDLPVPGASASERQRILAELETQFAAAQADIVTRVRRVARPLLINGTASMAQAAEELGLSTRTLRRRLAESGMTFEAIRDEVRLTLAKELLALTDLPVGEVAEALAFATHAAFTNAFLRWNGETPSRWRARHAPVGSARTVTLHEQARLDEVG